MSKTTRIAALAGLAALTAFQAAVAWNASLYWRARAASRLEERARLLERARAVFRWNELVDFELGKVRFERAVEALGDPVARDADLETSVRDFLRALRLNPALPAVHFHFAQALLYMSYLGRPTPVAAFEEYRRAAGLTGHKSQIFFEVGLVLLGRWEALSADEREFALGLLRRVFTSSDEDRLRTLLEAWHLHSGDETVIERVLPDDPSFLRHYARFLGEKGLSLEARWRALARAEALEARRAREELDRARRAFELGRRDEASRLIFSGLKTLEGVRFYQGLTGLELYDPRQLEDVRKGLHRLRVMARIDETRSLDAAADDAAAYLALEDEFTALSDLESFIRERGLLGEGPTAASPVRDLETLAFRVRLDFALNRYRDIVRAGDLLRSSSLVISGAGRPSYARVLGLVADSHLKLDNVYEAEAYYRAALEVWPDDLQVLLGLESCYGRLNDDVRAAETRRLIERIVSPPVLDLGGRTIARGQAFETALVTDGRPRKLQLEIAPTDPETRPLVSVVFDGRVVWEGRVGDAQPAFEARPRRGPATLRIEAVSGPARLIALRQEVRPGT